MKKTLLGILLSASAVSVFGQFRETFAGKLTSINFLTRMKISSWQDGRKSQTNGRVLTFFIPLDSSSQGIPIKALEEKVFKYYTLLYACFIRDQPHPADTVVIAIGTAPGWYIRRFTYHVPDRRLENMPLSRYLDFLLDLLPDVIFRMFPREIAIIGFRLPNNYSRTLAAVEEEYSEQFVTFVQRYYLQRDKSALRQIITIWHDGSDRFSGYYFSTGDRPVQKYRGPWDGIILKY